MVLKVAFSAEEVAAYKAKKIDFLNKHMMPAAFNEFFNSVQDWICSLEAVAALVVFQKKWLAFIWKLFSVPLRAQ